VIGATSVVVIVGTRKRVQEAVRLVSVTVVWGELAVVSTAAEGTHNSRKQGMGHWSRWQPRAGEPAVGCFGNRQQAHTLSGSNQGRRLLRTRRADERARRAVSTAFHDSLRSVESPGKSPDLCGQTQRREAGTRLFRQHRAGSSEEWEDTKVTTEVKDLDNEMPACSRFGGSK